mmetsp:Transcript_40039/g.79186  ORF Transcript_40039/g.79186 Transcript_40039/m.79186 type:complete len:176 (+) Transcript_40039:68-595(+)
MASSSVPSASSVEQAKGPSHLLEASGELSAHHFIWSTSSDSGSKTDSQTSHRGSATSKNLAAQASSLNESLHCPWAGSTDAKCRPCIFFFTTDGCKASSDCKFCHVHRGKSRLRPSKSKRAAAKRVADMLDDVDDAKAWEEFAEELAEGENLYLHKIIKQKMDKKHGRSPNLVSL